MHSTTFAISSAFYKGHEILYNLNSNHCRYNNNKII